MTWQSQTINSSYDHSFIQVKNFTLVKETPKAIRIKLENHPKKICIWMPKKCTRNYTQTSAWFVNSFFRNNVHKELQRLKKKEEKMEVLYKDFNNNPKEKNENKFI